MVYAINIQHDIKIRCIFLHILQVPDLQKDQWVAVDMGGAWYPGQFEEQDKEEKLLKINFLQPSQSSSEKFTWPGFSLLAQKDCSWVKEGKFIDLKKNSYDFSKEI